MADTATRLRANALSPAALGHVGLAGAALMALSSYWVGAIPRWYRTREPYVISWMPIGSPGPRAAFYVGAGALALAWLFLGRLILDGYDDWRRVRAIGLRWMAPFLFSAPLSSRDVWAYAAQGNLLAHGWNPYTSGPSVLPGAFALEVSHRWRSATDPYGPLWLTLGHGVAAVFGNHVTLTTYALRLFTVIGMVLLAWHLPTLSRRGGARAEIGLWLTIANPLFLIHGVGGSHNDILMAGLIAWGLALATSAGPAWRTLGLGLVAIAAAAAIKSPAFIAAAFAIPAWLAYSDRSARWRSPRAIAVVTVAAVAVVVVTFGALTAISGVGAGWVKQVNSSAPVVTWMSAPTAAAILWKLTHGTVRGSTRLDSTMRGFRSAGEVIMGGLLAALWIAALRRNVWPLLAAALLGVVLLGPTVQPWYFCWPLVAAAACVLSADALLWIGGFCVALVLMIRPNGVGVQMKPSVLLFLALGIGAAWLIMRTRERAPVSP